MADETRIIQINTGTTAQWNSQVRPMKIGEFGYNKETQEVKIGDGTSSFANLKAFLTGENALSQLQAVINAANGLAGLDASGKIPTARLPVIPTANLPVIPTDKLPTIPAANLPTIPTDKLPTIPEAKLPTIPEAKLPADTGKFFVGELYFQLVIRAGFVWANGQTLSGVSTKYPKLVAWLKDSSTYGGAAFRKSLAEWNAEWNDTKWNKPDTGSAATRAGMSPYYVLDESANTIKVPDLRGAYLGATGFDGQTVGKTYADAIRNILGEFPGYVFGANLSGTITMGATKASQQSTAPFDVTSTRPGTNHSTFYLAINAAQQVPADTVNHPRTLTSYLCVYTGASA